MLLTLTITPFILLASIRLNTITFTSTISTTILIIIITTISITVAVTIALTSSIVPSHIIMLSTNVAIIVTCIINCTMNVVISTASNNASVAIPTPILLLSLLLFVRVPSRAQYLGLLLSPCLLILVLSRAPLFGLQDILPALQKPGVASGVCSCTYVYVPLYGVHIWMVELSNLGTYGIQFLVSRYPQVQRSRIQIQIKIQKSKNLRLQNCSHLQNLAKRVWIFVFFGFWISGCLRFLDLWLCGYLGTKKCISTCRRGVSMFTYIYIYYMYIHVESFMFKTLNSNSMSGVLGFACSPQVTMGWRARGVHFLDSVAGSTCWQAFWGSSVGGRSRILLIWFMRAYPHLMVGMLIGICAFGGACTYMCLQAYLR